MTSPTHSSLADAAGDPAAAFDCYGNPDLKVLGAQLSRLCDRIAANALGDAS